MKRPLSLYCLLFLTAVWLFMFLNKVPPSSYAGVAGQTVLVSGKVTAKESKNQSQILYLENVTICDNEESSETTEKEEGLICYLSEGELPELGAFVMLEGKIEEFEPATNPGEFDRRNYYLTKGYGAALQYAKLISCSTDYSYYRETLWEIRCYLAGIFDAVMEQEDAAALKAMLLGDRNALSGDVKELYQTSGIAHILAISGLHISILGMGVYRLLRKASLAVWPSVIIAFLLMVNYAVMTGSGISTLRAVIMFCLYIMADIFRRSNDLMTALAVAAVSVVLTHPYEILTTAFWLSYLAVFGIAVFYPALTKGIELENRKWNKRLHSFLSGLCVTIFTLPIILVCYYEFPLYSVFLNLIVLPCMTYLLLFGILALLVGCCSISLGSIVAWPCHLILRLYYRLCLFFEQLPYHSYITGCPKWWQIAGFYVIMLIIILWNKRIKLKYRPFLIMFALLLLFVQTDRGVQITMLDVGQGDGICIKTRDCVLMIDGGSSSKNNLAKYQLIPFMKHEGIASVDYWILTHPDADHISGLVEILELPREEIKIDTIVIPDAAGVWYDFADVVALAEQKGITIETFCRGERLEIEGLGVECLHPARGYQTMDVNDYSLVLQITYGDFSGIFTGDATETSEKCVLSYLQEHRTVLQEVDLLKVGHHGSDTSSSEDFLHMMNPQMAWISCGVNNVYGHPNGVVLLRLEEIGADCYRTDEGGAVIYCVDG